MKQIAKTSSADNVIASLIKLPGHQLLVILFIALSILTLGCRKHDLNPPPVGSYDLALVADNFTSPLGVVDAKDGSDRLFVIDQIGKVWIVNPGGQVMPKPFIDISAKMVSLIPQYDERGLLGLAFHPNFKANGKFYLFYTAKPNPGGPDPKVSWDNLTRISEFKVSGNLNEADLSSERIILEENHPQINHDGGTIAFGPDGYLYISIGDGGNKDDVGPGHVDDWYKTNAGGNGQDITHNLMGNILRIDVNSRSGDKPYAVPADNPFRNTAAKEEIYAYGFRNPYRFSFDQGGNHWLYAGDVGQSLYEEIDIVKKGGNYGWNIKEGTHCFNTDNDLEERNTCPLQDSAGQPLIDPVIEVTNYSNPNKGLKPATIAIVGGNVYRGSTIPFLFGKYIFGFLSADDERPEGKLMLAKPSTFGLWSFEQLRLKSFPDNLGQWLKGFGQGLDGEIYVTTSAELGPQGNTGRIYKLVFKLQ